jgi:hypothetical protein
MIQNLELICMGANYGELNKDWPNKKINERSRRILAYVS